MGVIKTSGRRDATYLSPSDCSVRPLRRDTSVSLPRGWFDIVIDDGSASTVLSDICHAAEMRVYETRCGPYLAHEFRNVILGLKLDPKVAVFGSDSDELLRRQVQVPDCHSSYSP